MINLDTSAGIKIDRNIIELSVKDFLNVGNPSNITTKRGQLGKKYIERTREYISSLFDINKDTIQFNSGASEGNVTIIKYFHNIFKEKSKYMFYIREHPSIANNLKYLNTIFDLSYDVIEPQKDYDKIKTLTIEDIDKVYKDHQLLILSPCESISGEYHKIELYEKIKKKYPDMFILADITQSIYRVPLEETKKLIEIVDFVTCSCHKFGSLPSSGFLINKTNMSLNKFPMIIGSQERGMRGGTENVLGIISIYYALKKLSEKNKLSFIKLKIIDTQLYNLLLKSELIPYNYEQRIPGIILVNTKKDANKIARILSDNYGIDVGLKTACATNVDEKTLRFSFDDSIDNNVIKILSNTLNDLNLLY